MLLSRRRRALSALGHNILDAGGSEGETIALKELVLELDPVQTQRVQEALQQVHAHQHTECRSGPDREHANSLT